MSLGSITAAAFRPICQAGDDECRVPARVLGCTTAISDLTCVWDEGTLSSHGRPCRAHGSHGGLLFQQLTCEKRVQGRCSLGCADKRGPDWVLWEKTPHQHAHAHVCIMYVCTRIAQEHTVFSFSFLNVNNFFSLANFAVKIQCVTHRRYQYVTTDYVIGKASGQR